MRARSGGRRDVIARSARDHGAGRPAVVPRGPLRVRGEATEVVERGRTAEGPLRGGASRARATSRSGTSFLKIKSLALYLALKPALDGLSGYSFVITSLFGLLLVIRKDGEAKD